MGLWCTRPLRSQLLQSAQEIASQSGLGKAEAPLALGSSHGGQPGSQLVRDLAFMRLVAGDA